jgi:hypothetical protein
MADEPGVVGPVVIGPVVVEDAPGASVPTRPSPIGPAFAAPTGGVTPVVGWGSTGAPGVPGDIAVPRPDGVVPGRGIVPAGA